MPRKHLFEYAVIRVVPRVEREEFINAGVILYSKELKYLNVKYEINEARLQAICDGVDCAEVKDHLQSFARIAAGEISAGPIAQLDLPSRFRWLTATRSTVVQTSKVHPAFCEDADVMLAKLFEEQVA